MLVYYAYSYATTTYFVRQSINSQSSYHYEIIACISSYDFTREPPIFPQHPQQELSDFGKNSA